MTADITPGQVKGLFFHLVREVGGIEAAGAYLGCSHQRVSQLQNTNSTDMPTIMQVCILEKVVGQDIVTGTLSAAATRRTGVRELITECCEATEASVALLNAARTGKDKRVIRAALLTALRELDDVGHALDSAETA